MHSINQVHTYTRGHYHRQSLCIKDFFSVPVHHLSLGLSHPEKFKRFPLIHFLTAPKMMLTFLLEIALPLPHYKKLN